MGINKIKKLNMNMYVYVHVHVCKFGAIYHDIMVKIMKK